MFGSTETCYTESKGVTITMTKFSIVLASDGSEGALHAARWLAHHFETEDLQHLTVLSVGHHPAVMGSATFNQMPAYAMAMEEAADEDAKQAAKTTMTVLQKFSPEGTVISGGAVVPAIVSYLHDHPADALVVGKSGHSIKNLLGSVSGGLANQSPIPVWVIG